MFILRSIIVRAVAVAKLSDAWYIFLNVLGSEIGIGSGIFCLVVSVNILA